MFFHDFGGYVSKEIEEITALPHDLGDGLVLRTATIADSEAVAIFNTNVHEEDGAPDEGIGWWTRDMFSGTHPVMRPEDFLVVEETRSGAIVSSLCLISQTWSYDGMPFRVGKIEMVGTSPDYRRRGLVRTQMDVVHAWSAARGEPVQVIGGIPWYYRQFGYEMALEAESGRFFHRPDVPKLADGATEPYRVRPATDADIPLLASCYERGMSRYRVACLRDDADWHYDLHGPSEGNYTQQELRVIETADGAAVGFLSHYTKLWQSGVHMKLYELSPGVSWLAVTPSVLRFMHSVGEAYAAKNAKPFETVHFELGMEHPLYQVFSRKLAGARPPYAWYVRISDLAGFLTQIAPALERRLADSILVGHTGELALNFYRTGLKLTFADGRLTDAAPWQPDAGDEDTPAFPDLTFLRLLFGYSSLDELHRAFPDCMILTDEAHVLLDTLFPKQASNVWPTA